MKRLPFFLLNTTHTAQPVDDAVGNVPARHFSGRAGRPTQSSAPTGLSWPALASDLLRSDFERASEVLSRGPQRPGPPALPCDLDDGVEVFRLTAEKIQWETKEGKLVEAMAYDRMVPGPVIRTMEGDRVRRTMTNGMIVDEDGEIPIPDHADQTSRRRWDRTRSACR